MLVPLQTIGELASVLPAEEEDLKSLHAKAGVRQISPVHSLHVEILERRVAIPTVKGIDDAHSSSSVFFGFASVS